MPRRQGTGIGNEYDTVDRKSNGGMIGIGKDLIISAGNGIAGTNLGEGHAPAKRDDAAGDPGREKDNGGAGAFGRYGGRPENAHADDQTYYDHGKVEQAESLSFSHKSCPFLIRDESRKKN